MGALFPVLLLVSAARPTADPDSALLRAVPYIDAAAREHLRREPAPGLALAVVADGHVVLVRAYGVADLASGAEVTAGTRFLAGSVSKAFTAVALLQLQEEGLLDVRRPVTDYLSWFRVRGADAPITLHHLLTHTAGLPRDRSDLPSSPYTALALRDRVVAAPPGTRFAYSNIGYQLLSLVIEEVVGRPFTQTIREQVLAPLGLARTDPGVTQEARLTTATGYEYLFDDRPPLPGEPVVPAAWGEYSAGDANLVTTAPDLGRFLAALLDQGAPAGHRLLQPQSFARLVQRTVPAPELGPGSYYGYGVVLTDIEGDPVLWHSGGMPGFRAMLIGDLDERVGVVLLMNGPGAPRALGEYALRALIAARRGKAPPPVPVAAPADSIPEAAEWSGDYADSTGQVLAVRSEGARLLLREGDARVRLLRGGPDRLLAADSGWSRYPLRGVREGGRIVELVHGPRWFRRVGSPAAPARRAPADWQAYAGHYRAQVPYDSNVRVVVRHGQLLLLSPEGIEEELVPGPGGAFLVGAEGLGVERVRFLDLVSGRALRLDLSGTSYYRATSP
ncbi:MAG: beta-lactamase family protein [Gemmatimonadetes bacterium]|nr:beta-lactamase family protein [Gemmatimonadota bacterium]